MLAAVMKKVEAESANDGLFTIKEGESESDFEESHASVMSKYDNIGIESTDEIESRIKQFYD